jgi:opacity protein-like surface antigen
MKIKSLFSVVFLSLFGILYGAAASAANGNQTYFGVQYAQIEEDELDLEPTAAVFRLGSMSNQGYGYELRLGTGLESDDRTVNDPFFGDVTVDLEVDTLIGFYLLAEGNAGAASIYGIVGYTQVDYTAEFEAGGLSDDESDDESDLSYGFGVNFGNSNRIRFNIEYMQYLDKNDVDANAISLGVLF